MRRVIALLLIVGATECFSSETSRDRTVLRFLQSKKAFLNWQSNWKKMEPRFRITEFKFQREDSIKLRELADFSFRDVRRALRLSFMFFCPNGSKAIYPFGFAGLYKKEGRYEIGFDDSNPFLLYDFLKMKSYELMFSGLYGPTFEGITWLSDKLAVIASASWVGDQLEMVRPELIFVDFKSMVIKRFGGNSVEVKLYRAKREHRLVVEPYLLLDYER